ncbi:MutS domain V [Microbulbifer yueqingensis]|uniref:MutS domain V n=2 Tax=Microbulbifer yueqingensis TaxID=658219 RepID=A0A1G9DPV2_9GAMM|nr:MutS domain V [Microbulbifer yueqingensis]
MENPPAEAARIREIQASIAFIQGQRALFDALPSAYASDSTEDYMRKILPAVDYRGWLEFVLGAVQIWSSQDSHFFSILRGVQCAAQMIQSLRQFTAQPGLAGVGGEFAPLLGDMKKLLARPELQRVPDHAVGGLSTWRLLRLDQLLRVQEKETVNQLLSLVYEMDALVSMADATVRHGFVMPQVDEGLPQVSGEGLFHPYLDKPVPNPVALDQQHRILFLTGPNMAGKTTYLRAFATALYLGHLGMGVPAASFRFAPVQRLFSSICLSDDLRSGVSYFRAEALRVKVVAEAVAQGEYVVALMDEPFKGTNVKDAFDASLAILQRLSTRPNCLFMFSSHHIELSEQLDTAHGQVDCRYFEAEESGGRLRFDYRLRPGVSGQRLGMRVLREEGIFDLLDSQEKATGTTSACARIERT